MSVETYNDFNETNALGMDLLTNIQHYYTLDTDGKPISSNISDCGASSSSGVMSSSYRLYENGVVVTKSSEEFDSISESTLGSYRFQQFPNQPIVTITEGATSNNTTEQGVISRFPLFNANASQELPTNTLSLDTFNTLFGNTELFA
jgi:hypothetical protein